MSNIYIKHAVLIISAALLCIGPFTTAHAESAVKEHPAVLISALGSQLKVGDVVFIRIPALPFKKVASTTNSWTNHVGIVIDTSGAEPTIAESRFPLSGNTSLSRFIGRSDHGRIAISRISLPLTQQQQLKLVKASEKRNGIFYDTGFDLHSNRQFCSRYVREVLLEGTGIEVGQIEDFSTLLSNNPEVDLSFWSAWYFGEIPWQRETVTPASLLIDPKMKTIFDGYAIKGEQK
ncbi:MAG: YebB family permuted papain-like enzyme [Gallionella sp.]|nr:YebB family permuted papain-like enzyme [Gallionella sp.]